MSENLYQHKYRIPSARLSGYDYAQDGFYFVTICTHDRRHYFGRVVGGVMVLNGVGQMADHHWREIPQHFPNVKLDVFVIMPNHAHGIIVIGGGKNVLSQTVKPTDLMVEPNVLSQTVKPTDLMVEPNVLSQTNVRRDEACLVSTYVGSEPNTSIEQNVQTDQPKTRIISPKPGSLSVIIGSYKSTITRESKSIDPHFTWQTRFYDCIIWDDRALNKIRLYIENNPQKWELEKNRTGLWM